MHCSKRETFIQDIVVSILYSASMQERVTTACFLLLQKIRGSLKRKQYPIVDR